MIPRYSASSLASHWQMISYSANICRFSLITLLAGCVLLLVGQGQDLIISTAEHANKLIMIALFVGSTLLWAMSAALWARILMWTEFPGTPHDNPFLDDYRRQVPRYIALLPFLVVILASWKAGAPATDFIGPALVTGIIFLSYFYRREIFQKSAHLLKMKTDRFDRPELQATPAIDLLSPMQSMKAWVGRFAFATTLAGLVLLLWGIVSPLTLGSLFNALILIMIWGATFLPLGSWITFTANKTGLPLVTLSLVLAVIFSAWNDNHAIRPLKRETQAQRISASELVDRWADNHCQKKGTTVDCGPMVIVATAGGGIRAAYWTGLVLGTLEDEIPGFNDRLLAISGVSGGSLGAAVYGGVVSGAHANGCNGKVMECSTGVLSIDYLSPLSASLLYPDLLQRFLPVALFTGRGATLEHAWEQGFREITGTDALAQSFSALGQIDNMKPWPALFLNATWSNNGRRIVASTVDISREPAFRLANDQLGVINYDIRLSTAAHNSARFPYVSPPGSWHKGKDSDLVAGRIKGRLQDGGLFENYGAETAMEILALVKSKLAGKRYQPIIIQISSDPTLPADLAKSPRGHVANFGYEVMTTIRTMANTRVGRGSEAAVRLRDMATTTGSYAHFRMCDGDNKRGEPPLGWALSPKAQRAIRGYLLNETGNGTHKDEKCKPENIAHVTMIAQCLSSQGCR
ncbi:MAG: hypothetical protein OEZ10_11090 [Gammaproteobacteria bacterium]|nr:hypothetical protein [Gammaproteobacteria bacterium]